MFVMHVYLSEGHDSYWTTTMSYHSIKCAVSVAVPCYIYPLFVDVP